MANALRDYVWFVDTAGASAIATETVVVENIRWVGKTTAGHTAVIQNANGETLWESIASADSPTSDEESNVCLSFLGGFIVPTLSSGRLYLTLKIY